MPIGLGVPATRQHEPTSQRHLLINRFHHQHPIGYRRVAGRLGRCPIAAVIRMHVPGVGDLTGGHTEPISAVSMFAIELRVIEKRGDRDNGMIEIGRR